MPPFKAAWHPPSPTLINILFSTMKLYPLEIPFPSQSVADPSSNYTLHGFLLTDPEQVWDWQYPRSHLPSVEYLEAPEAHTRYSKMTCQGAKRQLRRRNGHAAIQAKINSLVIGQDENSGFSKIQLLSISECRASDLLCSLPTHFRKYASPTRLFSRKSGRNRT